MAVVRDTPAAAAAWFNVAPLDRAVKNLTLTSAGFGFRPMRLLQDHLEVHIVSDLALTGCNHRRQGVSFHVPSTGTSPRALIKALIIVQGPDLHVSGGAEGTRTPDPHCQARDQVPDASGCRPHRGQTASLRRDADSSAMAARRTGPGQGAAASPASPARPKI